MSDHETRVDGDRLYVADGEGGWLSVGTFPDIFEVLGGETVAVEYDTQAAEYGAPWLDLDEDNVLTVDVRETLADMTFPSTFVEEVASRSADGPGVPERTEFFATAIERVWRNPGSLPDDENPFL
jgi:hypothetical protein